MQHNQAFLDLVKAVKSHVQEIDVHQLQQWLEEHHQSFTLIDVREKEEWNTGHIPSAIHISKGVIERDIERHIPIKDARIALYCGGGFRSALVAENLQRMGYTSVVSIDGGMRGWKEASYTVVDS